jgi:type II secretory pathway pseudopilin PulG
MSPEPESAGFAAVDERHPWLGLDSFSEATRDFFFGRDEEIAELARRVQRKLLTVLFGQSGLGKTSILRAGLVPRLRSHGYCPIYVRIAYSADAPEPGEQIKQTILQTARHAGQWTQAGVAAAGESLWEFLHHRDDVLVNDAGETLIPLLIFDQFEEIFTLAQADEAGRARAARFIADLADLVENRAPRELEARLEADDSAAERFDFARSDYRVLIALREDYLAPLESLKAQMPSITQNRLRLAPMTGKQGLEAVMGPGKGLVSQEVAEAIVRFVAGGAEIANAEVEPSLLSLVCRELNDTRIASGRDEISLDLLAGSHDAILSNFYERALADQPAAVRRVIEDELLTESGFRENVAEERLRAHFASAGAAPEALATLVDRRLLRVEERLDVRRVELTHDVLCGVVKASRDLRHEREAREATEKMLEHQRERAAATRRALIRARQVAAVCIVLAVGAIIAAIFAYWSTQRAKRAEAVAQQARVQAETLLGYLTAGFAQELENSGRLDVMASLAKREIDYFHGLPEEMQGPQTQRTAAEALVQFAKASRRLGELDPAWDAAAEAVAILEKLQEEGDDSEARIVSLARALDVQAYILSYRQDPATIATAQRALDVLSPLSMRPDASTDVRTTEIELLSSLGYHQANVSDPKAVETLQRSFRLAGELGAREVKDTYVSGLYVDVGAWVVVALLIDGRIAEAEAVGKDAAAVADQILTQRPGHLRALYAQALIQQTLGDAALTDLRPQDAIPFHLRGVTVQQTLVDFDPGNKVSQNNLGSAHLSLAESYWSLGELDESLETLTTARAAAAIAAEGGAGWRLGQLRIMSHIVRRNADAGRLAEARRIADEIRDYAAAMHASEPKDSLLPIRADVSSLMSDALVAYTEGDARRAQGIGAEIILRVQKVKANNNADKIWKSSLLFMANELKAQSELLLQEFPAAEQSARAALAAKEQWVVDPHTDARVKADLSTLVALALVGQDRIDEARQVIEPVVKLQRELAARNRGDQRQKVEMASALYVQALTDSGRRAALLQEARTLLAYLPAPMKSLASTRLWSERVAQATR